MFEYQAVRSQRRNSGAASSIAPARSYRTFLDSELGCGQPPQISLRGARGCDFVEGAEAKSPGEGSPVGQGTAQHPASILFALEKLQSQG